MSLIRVLVAIRNPSLLHAVGQVIGKDNRVYLYSGVQTAHDLMEKVTTWWPDIVLLDMWLPDAWGLEVARQIKAQPNAPCVGLLTLDDAEIYRVAATAIGVEQVIDKTNFAQEFHALLDATLEKSKESLC